MTTALADAQFISFAMKLLDGKAKLMMENPRSAIPGDHAFTRLQLGLLRSEVLAPRLRDMAAVKVAMSHLNDFGVTACEPVLREFASNCDNAAFRRTVERAYAQALGEFRKHDVRVYRTRNVDLNLHVFSPVGRSRSARPAIVFLFGGGWYLGKPEQFFGFCKYFARLGYVAISADYRIKGRHNVPPVEALKDVKSAMRYVRSHAAELGIDPQRICLAGWSAGGHLAMACAAIRRYDHEDDDRTVPCTPAVVVLLAPGINVHNQSWFAYVNSGSVPPAHLWVRRFVRAGLPPSITIVGEHDTSVDCNEIRLFTAAMERAGNSTELQIVKGIGHHDLFTEAICKRIEKFLKKTFPLVASRS